MSQITLIPDTETASVTLDITKTKDVVGVTRTNINGTSEVRLSAGQLPSTAFGQTVARTNHATNPSFETGLTSWSKLSPVPGVLTNPTTGGLFGSRHARLTTTGPWDSNTTIPIWHSVTLTGGKTYVASFHGKGSAGVRLWRPYVIDQTGTELAVTALEPQFDGAWDRHGSRFTVPGSGPQTVNINYSGYYPASGGTPVGTTIDFDGMMVEEATALTPYFDGSTTDAFGMDYGWSGTAHNAPSTLTTSGGRLILTDYEAANGLNTYNVLSSDGSVDTAKTTLVIDKPWLMVPIAPNYSEQVEAITDYSAGRETHSTVHRIIGRSDALVVMGKLGSRRGTLEFFAENIADVNRLARVFDRGEAVLLKQTVPGMDMYFTADTLDASPYSVEGQDATKYRLSVTYTEVVRPYGNLAGALGWTFDALANEYTSFDAVATAFATFDNLTLGDSR